MKLGRVADLFALPLRYRVALVLAATILYVALFLTLYPVFQSGIGLLAILPVAVTAGLLGTLPGLAAAIGMILLNAALFLLAGASGPEIFLRVGGGPGSAAVVGVALIIGQLHHVSQRLRAEVAAREKTERAITEERSLSEALRLTATSLTSTLDLDELMQRILNNMWRVVPHDAANIMLVEGGTARVVAQRGYRERELEQEILSTRWIIDELPNFKQVVDSGRGLRIADVSSHSGWVPHEHTAWIKSFMCAPIRIDGKVIGVINSDSADSNFFSAEDAGRLEAFADQAAIGIRNARLHALTREKVSRLELVSQIGQRTTAILDLDKLLNEAVGVVNELFGYNTTLIQMVEEEELVVRAVSHPALGAVDNLPRLKIGQQGITGWVAAHGEPLLVPDVQADQRYVMFDRTRNARSELAVPIRLRDVIIGVLDVTSDHLNVFSEIDITTLQTVADQLAVAIQNARLYERIQRRERYLAAVNRVGRRAGPERQAERYLQALADTLLDEFHYSRVVVMLGDDETRLMSVGALAGGEPIDDEVRLSYRQPYDVGILGRVMTQGKPYLARDVSKDQYYVDPPTPYAIASELAVPIRRRAQTIGVLSLQSPRKDNFDDLDLEAMAEVGEELGVTLENIELTEATRRHASELEGRVAQRTAELQAAKERLEELDKLKSKFVDDVSHELRHPVTNLTLYIDLLEGGAEDKRKEYIQTFRQQVSRLATLVESILNLSRLELGKTRVSFVPVNLNTLIAPVVEAFQPLATAADLRLVFEPAKKLPDVLGEPAQLSQVINNLIANAIQYTPSGEIRVATGVDRKHWQVTLTVSDTGMGIDPQDAPHLFERFYRGVGAAQSDIPGAGLGLAIVKEIVELHAGHIDLESEPGKGATFRVTLPLGKLG